MCDVVYIEIVDCVHLQKHPYNYGEQTVYRWTSTWISQLPEPDPKPLLRWYPGKLPSKQTAIILSWVKHTHTLISACVCVRVLVKHKSRIALQHDKQKRDVYYMRNFAALWIEAWKAPTLKLLPNQSHLHLQMGERSSETERGWWGKRRLRRRRRRWSTPISIIYASTTTARQHRRGSGEAGTD